MYYYHQVYYDPRCCCPFYTQWRQMPPVDPATLHQSANQTKILMKEASIVLNKLAESKEFDTKLMNAAQVSNMKEVKRLIRSLGVTSDVDIYFNPDGLRLEFKSKREGMDCCRLFISLRWN